MALFKIADFNPNYREQAFDGEDVKGLDVYAGRTAEKIGTIDDVLVDETGCFRYFVIDTGFWIFGKKVLLPVGRCRVDADARRLYAVGISSKEQAEKLPEYDESMTVDYDYEERVRGVYRTPTVKASIPTPTEISLPVEAPRVIGTSTQPTTQRPVSLPSRPAPSDHKTYTYEHEPSLYLMNEQDHQKLRLYEERLVVNKSRRQTGDVTVGKRVETEIARASVPVEKERIVIERRTPEASRTVVAPSNVDFQEGEVAHMAVYEEMADITKQAFVREEVRIRKEVQEDTVEATERLRREELDVHTEGRPVVERFD